MGESLASVSSEMPNEESDWRRCLRYWPEGEVWFQDLIPKGLPWGDDSLLAEVPDSARGSYGMKVARPVRIDGESYAQGNIVTVDSRQELERLLEGIDEIEALIFPWYDKMVPPLLLLPHRHKIDLVSYRSALQGQFWKSLAITVLAVAFGFQSQQFLMLALLAGTFYGLFPLVEAAMGLFRRVDRYSVAELNRRTVSGELFRRWILTRSTGVLKISLVVLVLIFVGQILVGINPSVERAALLKSAVLNDNEWWRTVTTGLMHGSWLHILFNGMALYSLGRVVVALVSPSLLMIVFLFTVITGSLASLWLGSAPASVGASGGILGCLGYLLVVCEKFKRELPHYLRMSLVQSTIVIAIFGFLGSSFIDNAAHAGGFLGGMVLGLIQFKNLRLASRNENRLVKILAGTSIAIMIAGIAKIAFELWQLNAAA